MSGKMQVRFEGMTPLGSELERKVLRPFLYEPAKRGQLPKPLMILSITDGTDSIQIGEGRQLQIRPQEVKR